MLCFIMLNVAFFIVMLNVMILGDIMQEVVMLNVVVFKVVAPLIRLRLKPF